MSKILDEPKQSKRRTIVREMSLEDAHNELRELRRNLFDLRMKAPRGEIKNVREFAGTRKAIAMLLYKLRMAEILEQSDEIEFIEAPEDEEPEALIEAPEEAELEALVASDIHGDDETEEEEAAK